MKKTKLDWTIGGMHFVSELPRATTETPGVEARHLVAFERWVTRMVCEFGRPSADGLKYLRERTRLKAVELAFLVDVAPETVSRWENGKNEIPGSVWELVVTLAEERLRGRTDTLERLRQRHVHRDAAPSRLSMPPSEVAETA